MPRRTRIVTKTTAKLRKISQIHTRLEPWHRVTIAMILGVLTGYFGGEQATIFEPLGIIFLNLIKMITIPLILFTLIYGITNIESVGDIKRIGLKAVITFFTTAMLAVSIGILLSTFLEPGKGVTLSIATPGLDAETVAASSQSLMQILLGIIPTNAIAAMAEGHILQVILFAFFAGFSLNIMRDSCPNVIIFCHEMAQLSFKMIALIMKIAPLGVFGYMAYAVGSQGIAIVVSLSKLILTIFLACFIQYGMFGVLIACVTKLSPMPFYKKMVEPQLLAFSTSSSKATLMTLMTTAEEKLGISKQNSRFLLPLSSALNMDGGAIYQGVCAVFFAQMFGVTFTPENYLTLLFTCTLASIGGAGIPGGVLLFLGMVLTSVGLPLEAVLLVASVDRILDMITTLINVTGDACVTLLIDSSEKTHDKKKYYTPSHTLDS